MYIVLCLIHNAVCSELSVDYQSLQQQSSYAGSAGLFAGGIILLYFPVAPLPLEGIILTVSLSPHNTISLSPLSVKTVTLRQQFCCLCDLLLCVCWLEEAE